MSTTDGTIDQKLFYDFRFRMDILLSTTENSYAKEKSDNNKILFITFSINQSHNRYSSINLKYEWRTHFVTNLN